MNPNPAFSIICLPIRTTFKNKHEFHNEKKVISLPTFVLLIITKKETKKKTPRTIKEIISPVLLFI